MIFLIKSMLAFGSHLPQAFTMISQLVLEIALQNLLLAQLALLPSGLNSDKMEHRTLS